MKYVKAFLMVIFIKIYVVEGIKLFLFMCYSVYLIENVYLKMIFSYYV